MNLQALHKLSYGMYIVSSVKDGKLNGQVSDAVLQVTSEPPMIAVCINKQNLTHECIMSKKAFSVSILSVDAPMAYIGKFGFKSGRDTDKFKDTKFKTGSSGVPIPLDYAIGYIEAEVTSTLELGTHTLFIGKIIDADITGEQEPMTYAYYHLVKGGKIQKNSPTYNPQDK